MELSERISTGDTTKTVSVAVVKYGFALCQGICKYLIVCRNGYRLFDVGRVLISHKTLPTDILPINI